MTGKAFLNGWNPMSTQPKLSLNNESFFKAYEIHHAFLEKHFSDALRSHREKNPEQYIPVEDIHIHEQNKLVPQGGYLSLYCDLLGTSNEIVNFGADSLPDYYGAALVSSAEHPAVKVYLLSDSCLAFSKVQDGSEFVDFVSTVFSKWLSDGMLPQCFIGYGTFVDRRPDFGFTPKNFFGTQLAGTSLVDAANIEKESKPLGARIILSTSAWQKLPGHLRIVKDGKGNLELLPPRPMQFDLFDCIYYSLCISSLKSGTRVFDHYVYSLASRAMRCGTSILGTAYNLSKQHLKEGELENVINAVDSVLNNYLEV